MKRKLDNNSKFLFMVSGSLIALFIIIFIGNMINQDTYSADTSQTCTVINDKCCSTETTRWSGSYYENETLANNACLAKENDGDYKCITAYESDIGTGKYRYRASPSGSVSGYDYVDSNAAMVACYNTGASSCTTEREVIKKWKYRYYEYSDCGSIPYNTCVKISGTNDSYKLCYGDTDTCLDNVFPNLSTCERVRDSGENLDECVEFNANGETYFYRGKAIFKYDGETILEKYCYGNGSHCYVEDVPEYTCPNEKEFIGWVYDLDDCGNSTKIINPETDDVTLYIGPTVMKCGETKPRDIYACCQEKSKPSSSSSSSSKSSSSSSSSSVAPSSKPSSSSSSSSVAPSSKPSSSSSSSSVAPSSKPSSSSSSSSVAPSSKPSSSSSSSSVAPSSKPSSSSSIDPLPPENPDTGNIFVYLVFVIGLVMVGYSFWYFKKYN